MMTILFARWLPARMENSAVWYLAMIELSVEVALIAVAVVTVWP